jgi:hypothetical protein
MSFELSAEKYGPDQVENLSRLVARLVPNPDHRGATEPGFCVYRAWFRDSLTADQGEEIMMHAQLRSQPDIQFLAILAAGNKPAAQGLLERHRETEAGLTPGEKKRISNLRAYQRTIRGLAGDEVVTRVVESNHAIAYGFWWEVNGTEDNVLIPHLSFTMDVGKGDYGPVPSSLSQEAAMALWDKILSSIRLHQSRPGQAPRPLSADSAPGKRDAHRGT